jgi:hypothetical protein
MRSTCGKRSWIEVAHSPGGRAVAGKQAVLAGFPQGASIAGIGHETTEGPTMTGTAGVNIITPPSR